MDARKQPPERPPLLVALSAVVTPVVELQHPSNWTLPSRNGMWARRSMPVVASTPTRVFRTQSTGGSLPAPTYSLCEKERRTFGVLSKKRGSVPMRKVAFLATLAIAGLVSTGSWAGNDPYYAYEIRTTAIPATTKIGITVPHTVPPTTTAPR